MNFSDSSEIFLPFYKLCEPHKVVKKKKKTTRYSFLFILSSVLWERDLAYNIN